MTEAWYDALTAPRSIAVIGASNDGLKASGRVLRYLVRYGFPGDLHPVNPTRDTVQGIAAHPSLAAIGKPVDLAIITTPAERAVAALQDCVDLEVPAVIVLSSGFAEVGADGAQRQAELKSVIRGTRTRVMGPNCVGLVNARASMAATINTGMEQDRFTLRDDGVALLTQSGAVGSFLLNTLQSRQVGLGVMVSTGNEMDLTFPEMLRALVDDPSIKGIGGYIEGIQDGASFVAALAHAREVGKPLGFLKVGRTAEGVDAIASHTGALAGADDVYDEVFRQYGVTRLDSFESLGDWLQMAAGERRAAGPRLSVATTSGGVGVMVADYSPEVGVEMASFEGEYQERLAAVLPSYVGAHNPIDMTGAGGDPETLRAVVGLMDEHPGTDIALVVLGNLEESEDELVDVLAEAHASMTKPLVVVWIGGSGRPLTELAARGVPAYSDPQRALRAMRGSVLPGPTPGVDTGPAVGIDEERRAAALQILAEAAASGVRVLDEHAAKSLLRLYGLPVVEERVAADPAEAAQLAEELGFPAVVKLLASDLAHKSEIGGVLLDLHSAEEVRTRATAMLEAAPADVASGARLLVQPMAAPGVELLLGLKWDPAFGHVLLVGMGGTMTEILDDVSLGVVPMSHDDLRAMVDRLRLSRLLGPVRGAKGRDVEAVVTAMRGLSTLALELGDAVRELDINPLIVGYEGDGASVVDAVIILPA